jgi:hypothetical protein
MKLPYCLFPVVFRSRMSQRADAMKQRRSQSTGHPFPQQPLEDLQFGN